MTDWCSSNLSDSDDDNQYRNENNETDLDFDSSKGSDMVMRYVSAQEVTVST